MKVVVLVRHAETAPNRDRRLLGRFDPPLTELGHAQAAALAHALVRLEPAAIVSSPMTRTLQTAERLASACGVEVVTDERLVEIDYGEFDGVPVDRIPRAALEAMATDPDFTPAGGESMRVVMDRIGAWCSEALSVAGDGPVVAVTHMSPIKAAVAWALGVPPNLGFRMRVDVASITRLGGRPEAPVLLGFNDGSHLHGESGPPAPARG